jgi:hypothetical protein
MQGRCEDYGRLFPLAAPNHLTLQSFPCITNPCVRFHSVFFLCRHRSRRCSMFSTSDSDARSCCKRTTMSRMQRMALLGLCFVLTAGASFGQNQAPPRPVVVPQPTAAPPVAHRVDVTSPDATIAAAYDAISGPAAQKRDWHRRRSFFNPAARLVRTAPKKESGMGQRPENPLPAEFLPHSR